MIKLFVKMCLVLVLLGMNLPVQANSHPTTVSLDLQADTHYTVEIAGFVSSDVFDLGNYLFNENSGAVRHTYQHGPKTINYRMRISERYGAGIKPIDNQCILFKFSSSHRDALAGEFQTSVDNAGTMTLVINQQGQLTCDYRSE